MNKKNKIHVFTHFLSESKRLFWDMDIKTLDPVKSKCIIIERIVTRGDFQHINQALAYYGKHVFIQEVTQAGDLDRKTLNWLSKVLEIPKTQFICYTKKQSNLQHWNS
jgi:hypothetical protein